MTPRTVFALMVLAPMSRSDERPTFTPSRPFPWIVLPWRLAFDPLLRLMASSPLFSIRLPAGVVASVMPTLAPELFVTPTP